VKIFLRKLHRWLGLLMAVQIIAWMASGLYFSIFPIQEIRGEHLTRPAQSPGREQLGKAVSPTVVMRSIDAHFGSDWTLHSARLVSIDDEVYWRVAGEAGTGPFTRLVGPDGSGVVPQLGSELAGRKAQAWLKEPTQIAAVEWLEPRSAGSEFRGRDTAAWKVSFNEPESLNLYLHPWTGEILARRTDRWRIFDFFWMLHIMDFDTRDNFSHPLLQVAAALGLIVALSGLVFWILTTRLFRRRKPVSA
jgi:uncharacterized iron-regulated membrane protein